MRTNKADISLKSILANQELEGFQCICGENYLNRSITGVHIMDNPDTTRFFRTGEVVMTTGYILKDFSKEDMEKFIRHLCERGCSGIIFKINRFYDTVPEEMRTVAIQYDIPIVTMPYKYAMADVQTIIMRQIFMKDYDVEEQQNYEVEEDEQKYADFLKILLSGMEKKELEEKCSLYNFDVSLCYVCILIKVNTNENIDSFLSALKSQIQKENMVFYQYRRKKMSVLLVGKKDMSYDEFGIGCIKRCLNEQRQKLENYSFIGIGDIAENITRIKESFGQAHLVCLLQEKKQDCNISEYNEQEMLFLMRKDMKEESLRKIYCKIIKPVIVYDMENGTELLKTVEKMVEKKWNLKETAESLFIHRNTLMNRREKIGELVQDTMGMDMHTAIQMGLYAYQILNYFY